MDDEPLRALLRSQERLITRRQAAVSGVTRSAITAHRTTGRWRLVYPGHHGVYVVNQGLAPLSDLQEVWAALLAVGRGSVGSHETAIWLTNPVGSAPSPVHVAVTDGSGLPRVPGVKVHTLPSVDFPVVNPAPDPPRVRFPVAVIDAAHAAANERKALAFVYAAIQCRRTGPRQLADALAERKRHRYRALLESVLVDAAEGSHSGLEREHARCMRSHGLPLGRRQRKAPGPLGSRWIDVLVGVESGLSSELVTELDGRTGHDKAEEEWRDMDRDNLDEEAGRGHLRYGPAQVFGQGCRVAGQTRRSLVRRGWRGAGEKCGPCCTAFEPRAA